MRILAIQLNQPGDAILTTPALRWLTAQGHEVHALLQPLGAELLRTMPDLASVEALPRDSIQLGRDLRRAFRYRRTGFDRAIVFSKCSDRPALWATVSGAKERIGLWTPRNVHLGRFGLINRWVRDHALGVHTVRQHLSLAGAPPEAADHAPLVYHPPEHDRALAVTWLQTTGLKSGGYLIFHTGSRWPSKVWPLENWIALIHATREKLGLPVVVTCGRDAREVEFTRQIMGAIPGLPSEAGTLSVNRLGAMLQTSAGFVGVDSMPMHLAAALGLPGIALFGPTDEKTWGPWQSNLTVVRNPCACLNAPRTCPKGVSRCLAELSAETALAHLAQALQVARPAAAS